jgi:hypothetical protein
MPTFHKSSVKYRREKSSGGFIVETNAHERHWLHHSQATFQTPEEKLRIARRHEEARSPESRRGADESLQPFVCFRHSVAEECDRARISDDTSRVFDDSCGCLFDRIA